MKLFFSLEIHMASLEVNYIACKRACCSYHGSQVSQLHWLDSNYVAAFFRHDRIAFALLLREKGREDLTAFFMICRLDLGQRSAALDPSRAHFGETIAIGGTGPIMQSVQESLKPFRAPPPD